MNREAGGIGGNNVAKKVDRFEESTIGRRGTRDRENDRGSDDGGDM